MTCDSDAGSYRLGIVLTEPARFCGGVWQIQLTSVEANGYRVGDPITISIAPAPHK
jgi:hypothetical protein